MTLSSRYFNANRITITWLTLVLTIFFAPIPQQLAAQKLDSLKSALRASKGRAECSTLYEIAYEVVDVDYTVALDYAAQAIRCANLTGDTLQMVKATRIRALAFSRLGELDSAIATNLSVLPVAREKQYNHVTKYLLHGLGLALLHKGQYDEALKYNFEALEIRRKFGGPAFVAATYNNIGLVYYKLRDYRKAVEYYESALEQYAMEPGNDRPVEMTMVNIALCYAYTDQWERADSTIVEVLRHCGKECLTGELENIAFCRGVVALGRRDTVEAKARFLESYGIATDNKDGRLELDNIVKLSQIYLGSRNTVEAERYLRRAEQLISDGISYNLELMKVYSEFVKLYEVKGDYRKAVEYQRRFMAFRDSVQSEETTTRLMRIEAGHVESEKNAKIAVQNTMLALNQQIISRQRIAAIFAFSTVALLAGFIVLLIRSVREKKNRNADLEERVRRRTAELEALVKQSRQSLAEKKIWIEKISSSVRNTTHTVNGLQVLAAADPGSREKCGVMIENELNHLLTEVNSYVSRSDAPTTRLLYQVE